MSNIRATDKTKNKDKYMMDEQQSPPEEREVPLEEEHGDGLLGPQKNKGDGTRPYALKKDLLGAGVQASREAMITFTFKYERGNSPSSSAPALRNFFPRKIFGEAIEQEKKKTYTIAFDAQASVAMMNVGPSISMSGESKSKITHRLKIEGEGWTEAEDDDDITEDNAVFWTVQEQGGEAKQGIPNTLYVGFVVAHDRPFQAEVQVRVKSPLSLGLSLFGRPWSRDDPVIFDGTEHAPIQKKDFATLTTQELADLVPYEKEWKNILAAVPPSNLADSSASLPLNS
ncbi:hypothetical protein MBLNU459_g4390t1 [Dothideomycetes sp. NU459]